MIFWQTKCCNEARPTDRVMQTEETEGPAKLPFILDILPSAASAVAIGTGAFVLFGWIFGIEALKRVVPGFVAMNPLTAILFVGAGLSLFGLTRFRNNAFQRRLARALAIFVGLVGLLKLLGLWSAVLPTIDQWHFSSQLFDVQHHLPNRMAPNSALNFVLVALSLLTLDLRAKRFSLSQGFALITGFSALLTLTGYVYGVQPFRGLASFIPMAVHTAITFLFLAGGLFFARPEAYLARVFASNDPRGIMARRLFPLAVLLTLFLGWLRVYGERHEYFDSEFGTALFAISLSILLVFLVRWTIRTVGRLETERARTNARLHDLNRRKDEMIAVVSHDLCTPLTGFRIVIDLLRDKNAPAELLDIMDQSTRRMVSMVKGLLDVAKLESDEPELECEELFASEVLQHSIEPLSINADAKNIKLELEVKGQEPVLVADRLRLSQIFNNLLSNAVKFTAPGGRVFVTVENLRNSVRVSVTDTGLGIPENDLPHIFDKYYQASSRPTAGETGTGLGLAIVRELVLLHEGQIAVNSEVNRGTTFVVTLPAKRQPGTVGSKVSVRAAKTATGSELAEQTA